MIISEPSPTVRTRQKIDENLDQLVKDVNGFFGIDEPAESERQQKLRYVLFAALSWTADDVLDQTLDHTQETKS